MGFRTGHRNLQAKLFDDVDPYRGTVVARVPAGTRADAAETGCAAGFAGFQVRTATRLLRQAANWGYLPVGEVIRSDTPGTFALALRRPLGVVGPAYAVWTPP